MRRVVLVSVIATMSIMPQMRGAAAVATVFLALTAVAARAFSSPR
jgi:hypothetical protein